MRSSELFCLSWTRVGVTPEVGSCQGLLSEFKRKSKHIYPQMLAISCMVRGRRKRSFEQHTVQFVGAQLHCYFYIEKLF
jgi:hypothetical protein